MMIDTEKQLSDIICMISGIVLLYQLQPPDVTKI